MFPQVLHMIPYSIVAQERLAMDIADIVYIRMISYI